MRGRNHVALGLVTGTAVAQTAELDHGRGLLAMMLAATTSTMPDLDLRWSGIWAHRRMTHWWPPALLAWLAVWAAAAVWVPAVAWAVPPAAAGWFSHLVGDAVFGKAGGGRRAGIPMEFPNGMSDGRADRYAGLGLESGGKLEEVVTALLIWPAWLWLAYEYTGLTPGAFLFLVGGVLIAHESFSKQRKRGKRVKRGRRRTPSNR